MLDSLCVRSDLSVWMCKPRLQDRLVGKAVKGHFCPDDICCKPSNRRGMQISLLRPDRAAIGPAIRLAIQVHQHRGFQGASPVTLASQPEHSLWHAIADKRADPSKLVVVFNVVLHRNQQRTRVGVRVEPEGEFVMCVVVAEIFRYRQLKGLQFDLAQLVAVGTRQPEALVADALVAIPWNAVKIGKVQASQIARCQHAGEALAKHIKRDGVSGSNRSAWVEFLQIEKLSR